MPASETWWQIYSCFTQAAPAVRHCGCRSLHLFTDGIKAARYLLPDLITSTWRSVYRRCTLNASRGSLSLTFTRSLIAWIILVNQYTAPQPLLLQLGCLQCAVGRINAFVARSVQHAGVFVTIGDTGAVTPATTSNSRQSIAAIEVSRPLPRQLPGLAG